MKRREKIIKIHEQWNAGDPMIRQRPHCRHKPLTLKVTHEFAEIDKKTSNQASSTWSYEFNKEEFSQLANTKVMSMANTRTDTGHEISC